MNDTELNTPKADTALLDEKRARANVRTALIFGGVALGMVGMAFAAVPLYRVFCQVTGYGGTTQQVADVEVPVLERSIRVRFDGRLNQDMPWGFKPEQRVQTMQIGEKALAYFEAYNPTDEVITGSATFNVTPHKAGPYFAKIDCFCFTEQTLKPGERVDMPVLYYVDPAIADDPDLDDVTEITLSYTFFRVDTAGVADAQDGESSAVSGF